MTKTRQEIRHEQVKKFCDEHPGSAVLSVEAMFDRLANALDIQCIDSLERIVGNTDNKWSRQTFTLLTGQKLPRTHQGTIEVIRGLVGHEVYDEFKSKQLRERLSAKQLEAEKRAEEARQRMLAEKIRWHHWDTHQEIIGTVNEFLEYLVEGAESFEEIKRGFSARYRVTVKGKVIYTLARKDMWEEFICRYALKNTDISDILPTV